jgi:hypothetical protein
MSGGRWAGRRRPLILLMAVAVAAVLVARGPAGPAEPNQDVRGLDPAPAAPLLPSGKVLHGAVPHDEVGESGDGTPDPALAAAATAAAERFAAEWSAPGPDWQQRLAALSTPALASALADAEPPWPPPRVVPSPAVPLLAAQQWIRIGVATDRGEVVLDLILAEGHWLVAGVDWRPG